MTSLCSNNIMENLCQKHGLVSRTYYKKSLIMASTFGSKSKFFMTMSIPSQDEPLTNRPMFEHSAFLEGPEELLEVLKVLENNLKSLKLQEKWLIDGLLIWPPRVILGRLLLYARGLEFEPHREGFPLGMKQGVRMVSLTITFYHEGVFVGPPLEYLEGNKDTMKDLDFGNFTYGKFFECIKAATLFPPVGIFYCLPGSDLSDGIRELKNEQQLADFVATALGNGGHIDVYVEHHGYDIHDWFAKDNDDLEDYDEDECVLDDISSFVEEPQFIGEEEVIIPNRCTSDPFLNRLCKTDPKKTTRNTFGTNERNENALALVEDEQEDQSVDPIYKIKPGIVYPDHDPDQHWKDMVPILGMKFKDHEEMKMMLANYGVANGYQLWYKRNDYKSLLVLCGRNVEEGRCASKVGRKGIQKNVSKASKGK
ncbi:hypothetical protein Tco_0810773 [Tanacetum coccineum]